MTNDVVPVEALSSPFTMEITAFDCASQFSSPVVTDHEEYAIVAGEASQFVLVKEASDIFVNSMPNPCVTTYELIDNDTGLAYTGADFIIDASTGEIEMDREFVHSKEFFVRVSSINGY